MEDQYFLFANCVKKQYVCQNNLSKHVYLVGVPDMPVDVVSVGERLVTKQAFGRFLELEV